MRGRSVSRSRRYTFTIAAFGAASLLIVIYAISAGGDRIGYALPELPVIDPNAVREIVIDGSEGKVTLARDELGWVVRPGNYRAHLPSVEFLLDALVNLSITDVVSNRADPARFDLDDNRRVSVSLIGGGAGVLLAIEIGRRAATYGHTYIRIPGESRILQAQGQLRTAFNRGVEILRDKSVFAFDPLKVSEIVASLPSSDKNEVRVVLEEDEWRREDRNGTKLAADDEESLDGDAIESALSFFGSLPAYRFRYEGEALEEPWLVVEFVAERRHELSVYPLEGNLFPARTSDSEYEFHMARFQVSFITDPLGIEHPAEE